MLHSWSFEDPELAQNSELKRYRPRKDHGQCHMPEQVDIILYTDFAWAATVRTEKSPDPKVATMLSCRMISFG